MTRPSHRNTHSCPCSLPFPQPVSFHTHLFPLSLCVGVCDSLFLLPLSSSLSLILSIGEVFSHVLSIMSASHWEKSHPSHLCQPDNLLTAREGGRKQEMCFFVRQLFVNGAERNLKNAAVVSQLVKGFLHICQDGRIERQTSVIDGFCRRIIFANVSSPTSPQLAWARGEGWKTSVIHGRLFSSNHLKMHTGLMIWQPF